MKDIRMGFCPTMQVFLDEMMVQNPNIEPMHLGSAAQVLAFLRNGYLNAGLIGRIAKKMEMNNRIRETRLAKGFTLIGQFKTAISFEELPNMEIHTYLPEKMVESFIPEANRVIYHNSREDAFRKGIGSAVLIDWDDYTDDHELIIPVEEGGKVLKFRTPTLYYNTEFEDSMLAIEQRLKHTVGRKYEV